jgi:hypothetical protein
MRTSTNSINKLKNSNSNFNLKKSMNNFITNQIKGNLGERININTPKYIDTILSERDRDRDRDKDKDKERPKSPSFKNPNSNKLDTQSIIIITKTIYR